ncbi:NADH-quinone oxidoreductase subunit A [Thalassotalea sp. 1_MG-2023]|uniref:NADH-quinone oxidoreductase subunit A n=1 Tax=Thalassotalea sp. 1_MG-2023 TaxID=3062680 RepID=UPI0026E26403|nr:NADH-quinone oxidoreductase subunit A [Thalassotalea sp. 1_MG-2023]MDO6426582.1 NADH-quinone oxidoreductase subunit A [Thalassotalea sp. 1_MG-2023]
MGEQVSQIWPIAAYFLTLVIMLVAMMILSHVLGTKAKLPAKNLPYESGVISVNANKTRFTSHFFLYAVFFVIFDLETIFLFAWVIAFKESGWPGFIEASVFIFILLAALLYLYRVGALSLTRRHLSIKADTIQINHTEKER